MAEGTGRSPESDRLPFVLGVDVGGTKVLGVLLGEDRRVEVDARVATPLAHHHVSDPAAADQVIDAIAEVVSELVSSFGVEAGRLDLGVGIPGLVDHSGTMHFAPNLPAGVGVDFKERVEKATGVRQAFIENDATCAAIGEWYGGAAVGENDALVVTLGTGIGLGIIANRSLVRGAHGYAGEAGHMVVDPAGPLCSCGRRGCWERYASGSGLARLARDAASAGRLGEVVALAGGDAESVRGEHVTKAAKAGDRAAVEVMAELGWWTALGIANLTALLDPSIVVLGGGLAQAGELLLEPTRRAYKEVAYGGTESTRVKIVLAGLGELAGAVGAGVLAEPPGASLPGAELGELRRK